jgi:hypothetical protein
MDVSRLQASLRELAVPAQIETLARFVHELTIVGRLAYEPGSLNLADPHWLRSVNEIQHRVASHVLALLNGDANRYPDDVFVAVILEQVDANLQRQVAAAFARSFSPQAVA